VRRAFSSMLSLYSGAFGEVAKTSSTTGSWRSHRRCLVLHRSSQIQQELDVPAHDRGAIAGAVPAGRGVPRRREAQPEHAARVARGAR